MVDKSEFADWLRHPVTEAVIEHLERRKDDIISGLLNLERSTTAEDYGLKAMALRYHLDGIGEFLDTDSLKEDVCDVPN